VLVLLVLLLGDVRQLKFISGNKERAIENE
jgi:hypothetical protein